MTDAIASPLDLSPRARDVLAAARALLEEDGYDGLTMRALGDKLGMRAQSLYEHFADKRAIVNALVIEVLWECGERSNALLETATDPLMEICEAHRAWALAHPHLYQLGWGRPLDREVPEVVKAEVHSGTALGLVTLGDRQVSRTLFGFVHGLIQLEIDDRLPVGSDPDDLFRYGVESLRAKLTPA